MKSYRIRLSIYAFVVATAAMSFNVCAARYDDAKQLENLRRVALDEEQVQRYLAWYQVSKNHQARQEHG